MTIHRADKATPPDSLPTDTSPTDTSPTGTAKSDAGHSVSFVQAFMFWLKLGFISFGGPAGQIAIMHKELVDNKRWISERRFLHALNYCMVLPGPEAQQLAIYLGWLMHRTWGGIVAGVLFVLPSLVLLIVLSWVYLVFGHTFVVAALFYGVKPAVTAIVLQAVLRIGSRTLTNLWLLSIAAASFIAIFLFKIPFPLIVIAAAVIGFVGARIAPAKFQIGRSHSASTTAGLPAIIDDHSPTPKHARFSARRMTLVIAVGLLLWLVPIAALVAYFGSEHTFTQMGLFFTKAALMTFGGAYAVLPYVHQGAVDHYGWLSATQMIDGLALGETTPGPLIMVVTFVGFVGAYGEALFGTDALFWAGAAAACLVAWFTFLPSFVFIFVGGPMIESTHNDFSFTGPLTAITAAVVGVILNLAVFFAYHVVWPKGVSNPVDWVSAVMIALSALALIRFKWNVIVVIFMAAALGLVMRAVGG